jgi:hypothetical protein
MTLAQAETAFRSVTQPRELVAVYVPLKRFSIDDPQAAVFGALNSPDPARVLLIGEPGTGKSSAVHSALDGLRKMTGFACAPVFLTVGDVEVLKSGGAFLGHILQTLSAQADDYAGDLDAHDLERGGREHHDARRRARLARRPRHRAGRLVYGDAARAVEGPPDRDEPGEEHQGARIVGQRAH